MRYILLSTTLIAAFGLAGSAAAERALSDAARLEIEAIALETGSTPEIRVSRADGRPSIVTGDLSGPSDAAAERIALDFVARRPALFPAPAADLVPSRNVRHAAGRTVRLSQTYRGIPVVGAELAVVVRADGVVRTVSNGLAEIAETDVVPEVDAPEAALAARSGFRGLLPAGEGFYSRLVVIPVHGRGILAWELHFGAVPGLLSNVWAYVDAKTGEVVRYENRIAFEYRGRAFDPNPGPFGGPYDDPVEVVLDIPEGGFEYTVPEYPEEMIPETGCDYDAGVDAGDCDCPGGECVWLSHPIHLARSCPDYHQTIPLDLSQYMPDLVLDAHMCSEVQTAFADENDEFFFGWEGDSFGLDDTNMNDKFAEVQMFYIVSDVYSYFMDLMDDHPDGESYDWPGHSTQPLMATVNFKLPVSMATLISGDIFAILEEIGDPYATMYPFDNAFFMPGGPAMLPGYERPYDSIVFGQGTFVDFAWDGDVIRHEFTHSVANEVSVGVGQYRDFGDEWGVNVEQGGMSEGYADIYPAFMSDEPTMGEYSLAAFGEGNARDLAGDDVCPDFLQGEVHADSPAWSQSVYQARTAVAGDDAEDKHLFEQAAFVGLSAVVQREGFAEACLATLAAVEDLLGADARADAAEVFAEHQTDDCPRVMSDEGGGSIGKDLPLAAPAAFDGVRGDPFTPGIIQYMVTVGEGEAEAVNFEFDLLTTATMDPFGGEQGEPDMRVIARVGAPIRFSYDGASVTVDDDVLGPYPLDEDHRFSLLLEGGGTLPAAEYYVMPVNQGDGAGNMGNIYASIGAPTAEADGRHEADIAAPAADAGPPAQDAGSSSDASDGCGCSAAGAGPRPSFLGLLF